MPKRRLVLGILALGILAALIFAFTRPREPSYQGRALNSWLEALYRDRGYGPATDHSLVALRETGTNALSFLVRWYSYKPAAWQPRLAATIQKCPPWISQSRLAVKLTGENDRERVNHAFRGFVILGASASPAVPELFKLATNAPSFEQAYGATQLLGGMGPPALPALLCILTNRQTSAVRHIAAASLGSLGPGARPAIPTLIICMDHASTEVAMYAALALGSIGQEPEKVIPALRARLRDPRSSVAVCAADALGMFGPAAKAGDS